MFAPASIILVVVFLANPGYHISAPIFALVSANVLITRAFVGLQIRFGKFFDVWALILVGASSLLASYHWFLSLGDVSLVWQLLAVFLVTSSVVTIFNWIFPRHNLTISLKVPVLRIRRKR